VAAPRTAPAPATEARRPEPATAAFRVTSDPPGAAVLEGGKSLGRTPLTLRRPLAKTVVLVLRRDGYADTQVSVVPQEGASVHGKLDAMFELVP
jgi:hypothetical protein